MAQAQSMRDEPGTLREYETIYILRPEMPEDQIGTMNTRVRGIIEQQGGRLVKVENWGKRKLAYEIKKQMKGIYLYWRYLAPAGLTAELQRNLRMMDAVIRYYTVKVDEGVVPDAHPIDVDDEKFAQAAHVRPDEEEIATGAAEVHDEVPEGFEDLVGGEED